MRFSYAAFLVCALLACPALAAGSPQPMDSATMDSQPHLPDTVTADGMHVGSWSAGGAKAPAAPLPKAQQPAAQPAPAPMQAAAMPAEAASGEGEKVEPGHTMVVTSIQACYDQLDPADAADIRKNSVKPYEECQARLQAKLAGKRDLKQGEARNAATPETPRNYQRVAEPDKAAPVNP